MKTYLEIEETKKLEGVAMCLRDRLLIRILAHLGCRISEALTLKVGDIDFSQGTVTIQHLKTRLKVACAQCGAKLGRSHTYCPGCGLKVDKVITEEKEHRRLRTLPVDRDTLEMLADLIKRDKTQGLIFRINRHRAWQIIKECSERAGLPNLVNPETGRLRGVSPYRLRDAFSVHAMKSDNSGDGLRLLQEHLGHTSFNTTAKYRKIAGDEHRSWYDRLWPDFESIKDNNK